MHRRERETQLGAALQCKERNLVHPMGTMRLRKKGLGQDQKM